MKAAAFSALLLATSAHADVPLLEVVSRRTIAPSASAALNPPLAVVVEAGSGWEAPGRLEAMLAKATAIFAQCGLALGPAEVVAARWTAEGLRRLNVSDPYAGPAQIKVMDEPLLPVRRPAVFLFAKGTVPSTAVAYNATSVARLGRSYPGTAKLLNTTWMTLDQETRPRRPDELTSYSTFAHELTHLFGDLGHTDERPNLMTNAETPGSKSGDLSPAQCLEVRKLHGLP